MINVIGAKRLIILSVLVALNAILAAFLYQYTMPEIKNVKRELAQGQQYNRTKDADIERMQLEFSQLDEQQGFFDRLKEDKFFSDQSRREAEEHLLRAEKDSGIISAKIKISPGKQVEDEEAKKAGHVILVSPITITLEAMADPDIYRYLYIIQKLFPGHLSTDTLKIERQGALNDTVLRAISGGQKPPLVKATVELSWRTMIPAASQGDGGI